MFIELLLDKKKVMNFPNLVHPLTSLLNVILGESKWNNGNGKCFN